MLKRNQRSLLSRREMEKKAKVATVRNPGGLQGGEEKPSSSGTAEAGDDKEGSTVTGHRTEETR